MCEQRTTVLGLSPEREMDSVSSIIKFTHEQVGLTLG